MIFSPEASQAIEWTTRLAAVFVLLDSAEKLRNFREFGEKGLFNWNFLREHLYFASRSGFLRRILDAVFGQRTWLFLLFLRGACGFYLLAFPLQNLKALGCLIVLFAVASFANLRNAPFGAETESRFSVMIIGALMLQSIAPTEFTAKIALWFIALNACLSYVTAGISKLFNKNWRSGEALFDVLNSPNISASPGAAAFFGKHRSAAKFLTRFNTAVECAFPLVFFAGQPFLMFFLIWGFIFHLSNAVLLRLNKFFWVWMAAYPAVIFTAR